MHTKKTIPSGVAILVLFAASSCTLLPGADPTRLRIDIVGLPPGASGQVTVHGPDGSPYALDDDDERDVESGTYMIEIADIQTDTGTAYPVEETVQATVEEGQTTTVEADYAVFIPDTTTVLDHADPQIQSVEGAEVVFSSQAPELDTLEEGQVFISAEGPQTPHLLVRRVVSLTDAEDGTVVVDTEPASLDEALPSGVITFDDTETAEADEARTPPRPKRPADLQFRLRREQDLHGRRAHRNARNQLRDRDSRNHLRTQ